MVPEIVEGRRADLRRRLESPPLLRLYEETFRHIPTPIASDIRGADRIAWIKDHAPAGPVERVVDLGCGRGRDLVVMRNERSPRLAVGIDSSRALLSGAATNARLAQHTGFAFVRADLQRPPLGTDLFDWANCNGVLHRLGDPASSLAGLAALLRPGGVFTCLTTLRLGDGPMEVGQRVLGRVARVHFFARDDLEGMFGRAGLEITDMKPFGAVVLVAARRAPS
jgi:SAM-dependent methyltransferase